jgi:hypothetical protein
VDPSNYTGGMMIGLSFPYANEVRV